MADDVYFSAADGRVTTDAGETGFARALVHSALIDSRIVVPDIFFFNSPGLQQHVANAEDISLLEAAIQAGLVVPSLRAPAKTFTEIAAYLKRARIVGLLGEPALGDLAAKLDRALPGKRPEWGGWPAALGESYKKLLLKLLQVDKPPKFGHSSIDEMLWRGTEDLRYDAIEQALEVRRQDGGSDIRRGEIITQAGRILGVLADDEDIVDLDVVLRRIADSHGRKSPRFLRAEAFFEWLDELYRFNQADRMNIQPTATNSNPGTLCLLAQAYRKVDYGPADAGKAFQLRLNGEVEIPRFASLSRIGPRQLIELRGYGREWQTSAAAFLKDPQNDTRSAAERALEDYAAALRKQFKKEVLQTMRVQSVAGVGANIGVQAADAMMEALNTNVPVASVVAVLTGGYVATQYVVKTRGSEQVTKQLWQPRDVRVSQLEDPDPT